LLPIDLHCHSTFSLQDGFGTPENVVRRAIELGWGAASLTEHGWLGSTPTFYKWCNATAWANGDKKPRIKPIIGCEFYITPDHAERTKEFADQSFHLTVLALSKEGYQNLVTWTTHSHKRENFYRKPRISISEMVDLAPWPLHHNVILSGCLGSELCRMFSASDNGLDLGAVYVDAMKSVFPNFYIEVQNHEIPKFVGKGYTAYEESLETEQRVRAKLIALAEQTGVPLVLTNDSHFQTTSQRKAHIAMKASSWRSRDDSHYGKSQESLISGYLNDYFYFGSYMRDMEKVADGIPKQALKSVCEIVEEANIRLEPFDNFSYSIPFSGYADPISAIRRRCKTRLAALVATHGKSARKRFEYELENMGDFAHYLLLISDFIIEAKRQGILTNTRGSAANSLLCYCLKIHDNDSMHYGLTFERFYNPSRKKLPDIDLDIEADRYQDFMEFVISRMAELEGEGQVVQICNYGTLANRSAFRMAASALGIPKERQDEISKILPQMIDSGVVDEEADAFAALKDEYPELYALTSGIFDSLRNMSQHACGWLIGTKERPISDWVPLYLIASSGTMVTQYDMKMLGDLGWVKGDFLRLKALSVTKRTMRMAGMESLSLSDIPLDDPETFEQIRAGHTQGVHTLQGKENRKAAMAAESENVHDVITAVAVARPALTRQGYDKIYYARKAGREIPEYPHPIAEKVLGPTYGVGVFQEQVLEIGYAMGMSHREVEQFLDAIKLAKGMGRGAKEAFANIKPLFMKYAKKMKMSQEERDGMWELVERFEGYGFNKGHATSYGVLAVQMQFLRTHHSAEFFSALLDVYPEKKKYIAAARSEGFQFVAPCVNRSSGGFSYDRDSGGIRVGLQKIEGIGPAAAKAILDRQPFSDFDDFKSKVKGTAANHVNRVEALARIGAFEILGIGGEISDATEFELLGLTLKRPKVFKGCKPKHVGSRTADSGWVHTGLTKNVERSEPRTSVSKLFWVPEGTKLELKASPWAQVKTWLLTVVDENGLPFHLMVNEDKEHDVKLLKFIHRKCQGSVICFDGAIRDPFLTDGPQGFRMFGISGTFNSEPQAWHVKKTKEFNLVANELHKLKRYARSSK
jgi:DNA polymerase-3 subunit alpha